LFELDAKINEAQIISSLEEQECIRKVQEHIRAIEQTLKGTTDPVPEELRQIPNSLKMDLRKTIIRLKRHSEEIGKANRKALFADEFVGSAGAEDKKSMDDEIARRSSKELTEILRRTAKSMMEQVKSTAAVHDVLENDTETLKQVNRDFQTVSGHVEKGSRALKATRRREFTSKAMIWLAFLLYVFSIFWIVKVRLGNRIFAWIPSWSKHDEL
jgi:ElaB/YqjD/DUF883 family membrane-anchored ribosome-binding protein